MSSADFIIIIIIIIILLLLLLLLFHFTSHAKQLKKLRHYHQNFRSLLFPCASTIYIACAIVPSI